MNRWTKFYSLAAVLISACGQDSIPPNYVPQSMQTAYLSVSDLPIYDFGNRPVESTTERAFTITNVGVVHATAMSSGFYLSLHFAYKGGVYPGIGGTCLSTLKPGANCQVVITFTPQYEGAFQDAISITYHNGATNTSTAEPILKGRGIAP